MSELSVIIADDEPPARRRIERLLEQVPGVRVVASVEDGFAAVEAIRALSPVVVFLDVQMPGLDGFGVVQQVGVDRMPITIFVTAFDSHAVRAFESHAMDYLVKPYDDQRLLDSLNRARGRLSERGHAALELRLTALLEAVTASLPTPMVHPPFVERLAIRTGSRTRIVPVDEVDWIGVSGPYAELHAGGRAHVMRLPLHELETRLDPARFLRIHRSTIVNVTRVREIAESTRGEYDVVLADGTRVKMSRGRRQAVEEVLGKPL